MGSDDTEASAVRRRRWIRSELVVLGGAEARGREIEKGETVRWNCRPTPDRQAKTEAEEISRATAEEGEEVKAR